jgi:hypothetical protein
LFWAVATIESGKNTESQSTVLLARIEIFIFFTSERHLSLFTSTNSYTPTNPNRIHKLRIAGKVLIIRIKFP